MITQYRPSYYQAPRAPSFAGRSIDEKPLDVENGSTFKEIDTGRVFRYDKENNVWIEQKGATPVQPAKPEQAKTVDLNMATGNQTVLPDEGMTLSSATIIKPDTMTPENIKKDVNIGGVIGTLEEVPTGQYITETYDRDNEYPISATLHGYTTIPPLQFTNQQYLMFVTLPSEVVTIGHKAFNGCSSLALTSLPSGVTNIGNNAFANCSKLALTELPSGVTSIDDYAFYYCTSLALTSLPSGVTNIGDAVFYNCSNLTSIVFEGTPTSIASNAFAACLNLTDIKVPWAEGTVAGAPWGATNATITYNYTA